MGGPVVVFVCSGNTCRSPMAAELFRARLAAWVTDAAQWSVLSAGTAAEEGQPAAPNAQAVLAARGLDLTRHRARQVDHALLDVADLILVMEPKHLRALWSAYPALAERVYLLSEMSGGADPVADPYGRDLAVYEQAAIEIDSLLSQGAARIITLARRQ